MKLCFTDGNDATRIDRTRGEKNLACPDQQHLFFPPSSCFGAELDWAIAAQFGDRRIAQLFEDGPGKPTDGCSCRRLNYSDDRRSEISTRLSNKCLFLVVCLVRL